MKLFRYCGQSFPFRIRKMLFVESLIDSILTKPWITGNRIIIRRKFDRINRFCFLQFPGK